MKYAPKDGSDKDFCVFLGRPLHTKYDKVHCLNPDGQGFIFRDITPNLSKSVKKLIPNKRDIL